MHRQYVAVWQYDLSEECFPDILSAKIKVQNPCGTCVRHLTGLTGLSAAQEQEGQNQSRRAYAPILSATGFTSARHMNRQEYHQRA